MRPHSALIQHLFQELYLDDQWKFDADILRFGTTHEHYKTVEYEPDAAIGGGDSARYSVCLHAAASIILVSCVASVLVGLPRLQNRTILISISITNGRMRLIFRSLAVPMSTSKP